MSNEMYLPRNAREWGRALGLARATAVGQFGSDRATDLDTLARSVADQTSMSLLHALQIAIQIEEEFRGRAEEFMNRAGEASIEYGTPYEFCLLQIIRIERLERDGITTDFEAHEHPTI